MSNTIFRVGTANMYDNAIRNVSARQTSLVNLQENLTSGKRVVRASDDPVSAAQAERALTRISRIQTEQRALENQRNAIAQAESTMGDAVNLVQEIRQLIVNAGNGALKPEDRMTIANQLQSLREQLSDVANRKDTNGIPLLGALGSAVNPFLGPLPGNPDYEFKGQPGQSSNTGVSIANTLDGHSAFMFDPQRDGAYTASVNTIPGNRTLTTSALTPVNPSAVTGNNYEIVFSVGPSATPGMVTASYTIKDLTLGTSSATFPVVPDFPTDKPLSIEISAAANPAVNVPGLSFTINATPAMQADGSLAYSPATVDTISLQPSPSLFSTIDSAIKNIGGAANNNAATQAVGQALANIDRGLERMHNMRGYAGELLNRADRITGDQSKRSEQLEADRSRAEDLDMIKGISDFQNQQTGYQAALQTYASVQKLSLFNYIG
jgi:flagellar hook-associated protein 3 FlgL